MNSPISIKNKRALVMGVANQRSLAWGVAQALHQHGVQVALTHQGGPLLKRVQPLAQEINAPLFQCDAADEQQLDNAFAQLKKQWSSIDYLVHSIAFSDRDELHGKYVNVSLQNFLHTMHVSCFSFTSAAKRAAQIMPNGGSMLTMTYYGAEKAVPNYNVMGVAKAALEASVRYLAADLGPQNIRVNALSAGPVKTLAAAGVGGFRSMLAAYAQAAPLRRTVSADDVGNAAVGLLGPWSSAVTGDVLHVDAGFHAVGVSQPDEPKNSSS